MSLKYLFLARFSDSSEYYQRENDQSYRLNKKSCFYDVLQEIEGGKKLTEFILYNDELKQEYTVNLTDKKIQINIGGQIIEIPAPIQEIENVRVIYFRNHEVSTQDFVDKITNFTIGWQGNLSDGSNIQRVINIF